MKIEVIFEKGKKKREGKFLAAIVSQHKKENGCYKEQMMVG